MNEHIVLRPREPAIDLGAQPDFLLGPLGVTPSTCELSAGSQTWRLEPRVMQVLVALWRAQGKVVSRAELVSSCWNDRIVGDDALNRCIARLRRLFESADAPVSIITIARVGYRLDVEAPEAPPAEAPAPRRSRRGWLAVAAVSMTALAALGWWVLQRPTGWTAEGFRPFAAETLIERHPAFSPDGRSLAYAVGADVERRRIAVRELAGGPATQISEGPGDDYAPAWSPSGLRLAFARFEAGKPCRILVRRLPAGPADTVARCDQSPRTKLAWSRTGEALYFTDGPASGMRIRMLDLATGRVQDLTRPPAGASDAEPAVSPNGRRLAFVRGEDYGRGRLLSLDLTNGKATVIPSPGVEPGSVAWTPDGKSLVATSDRAGDFSLWLLRADGRGQPRLLLTGLRAIGRVVVSPQGQIAMEMDSARINLTRLGGGEISPANSSDWSPDFAPDGSVAFVSNRGGAKAVWVMRPGQSAYQLPGPQLERVYGVRWSPDGQRLAFSASSRDGVAALYVSGPDGLGLTRLNASASDFGAPAWSTDGQAVIAPARDGSGWRLVRAPLDTRQGAQVVSDYGWVSVRNGPEGMFGVRADQAGIWRIGAGVRPALVVPGFRAAQPEDWALAGGKLYALVRAKSARFDADVMIYPAAGGAGQAAGHVSRVSEMPGLAVDPKTGTPVFPRIIFEDSDLGLMTLKRAAP